MRNDDRREDTTDDRWAFNRRSCALTTTIPTKSGPATNDERPAAAAAASKWPMFDFSDAH
jgi:hypothetical protein